MFKAKRVSERPVSVSKYVQEKKTFEQVVVDRFSRAFEVDWERCKRSRHIEDFSLIFLNPGISHKVKELTISIESCKVKTLQMSKVHPVEMLWAKKKIKKKKL